MAWTYTQNFDSLNDGDLNGQDSWSGSTVFDVVTTSPYQGAKCVGSVLESDTSVEITRSITGVSTGTVYFGMKVNAVSGMRRGGITFYAGAQAVCLINISYSAAAKTIETLTTEAGNWVVLSNGISNDTWYRVGVEFDEVNQDNKFRVKIDNGDWSSWYNYFGSPSWTSIDSIKLTDGGNNGSGTGTLYFDDFSLGSIAYSMDAGLGEFTLTGIDVGLATGKSYTLNAETGSFSSTGLPADITYKTTLLQTFAKPTTTFINSQKVSFGATWATIDTTWDTEGKDWIGISQLFTNTSRQTSTISNIAKP